MPRLQFGLFSTFLALTACGCGPSSSTTTTIKGPSGTTSWYSASEGDPPSPLEEGTVNYAGTNLMVWSGPTEASGVNCRHSVDGTTITATLRLTEGNSVTLNCESRDGKSGPVTISGQRFDLADGNLFLVAESGDQPRVKQLMRDLSGIDFKDHKSIRDFGKSDGEILAFFTTP